MGSAGLLTLASSACWFLAVFLGALWIGPAWDSFSRRHVSDITPRLRALGLDNDAIRVYMRWWGVAIVGTFMLFAVVFFMVPVAIGVTYLVFVAPRYILDHLVERRARLLRDQTVRATAALANSVRAGLSLPQAMETVSQEIPRPLSSELQRIVSDYNSGRPLADAMRDVEQRLNLEVFTVFTSVILACMERGGRVTVALEKIRDDLMETQRLERKLEADTASGRKLAITLGCFPFGFLALFTAMDPASMSYIYTTLLGQMVLLIVGAMVYFSMKWCLYIMNIDV